MADYKNMQPLRYVLQTILPQVYTDALSNQELQYKIVSLLNDLISNNNTLPDYISEQIENYISSGAIGEVVNQILTSFMLNVKNPPLGITPAKGDGTADDTLAIQGCIDYARDLGGGCVYIPNGVYLTQPLVLYDNVSLFGFDRYSAKLVLKGGATRAFFTGNVTNTSISGLTIDGNMDIQVANINLIDVTAEELILQNLVLTDGYVLVNATVNKSAQISDVIFDYAVVKHMEISGSGLVLGSNLYLHDISAIKGQNLVTLNTSNSVISNVVSNGVAPKAFIINGNNNSISGTVDNAVVPFEDNGNNNTIVNNGKTEQIKITGNRTNNVGGNETDNITGKKVINASDIVLNPNNPLGYRKPTSYNDYFKTIPFKDSDNLEYSVLVKGNKDMGAGIDGLKTALEVEILERETADNTLQNNIDSEELARFNADTVIEERIDLLNTKVNNNIEFNILDYGAVGDGVTDCTQALKDALLDAGLVFGVVKIPSSDNGFLIGGSEILIPRGVTIQGETTSFKGYWSSMKKGSTLLITGNKNVGSTTTPYNGAVLLMDEGTTIKNLGFYYPEQTLTNPPLKYPFLIRGIGYRDMTLNNIFVNNSYQFADFHESHERIIIQDVFFDAYKTGILINGGYDVDKLINVHCWIFSLQKHSVTEIQKDAIIGFRLNNLEAYVVNRSDSIQMNNVFAWGAKRGIVFGRGNTAPYGQCTNVSTDGCVVGIETVKLGGQGMDIVNFSYGTGQDFRTKYNTETLVPIRCNHSSGTLIMNNVNTWGGGNYFLTFGTLYGSETLGHSVSTTIIDNVRIMDNFESDIIYNYGVNGNATFRNVDIVQSGKTLCTTDVSANNKLTFENVKVDLIRTNGTKPTIKEYVTVQEIVKYLAIPSSSVININVAETINITGNTALETINSNHVDGDKIVIFFDGTFIMNGTGNIKLASEINVIPWTVLTLVKLGANWFEVSRSIPV